MDEKRPNRPTVAIIGAGFGGLSAAKALKGAPVNVEIIDRRNYHLFQPLLYQVATADLSPADIAWPIRGIFSRQDNVSVTMSEVQDIDVNTRQVHTSDKSIDYDYLVVAPGSTHSYFGKEEWAKHAPGLKKIVDATEIRRRVLMAFERAELCEDREEQLRHLTFAIVGGGPTGVEMAGAIAELAHFTLARDFRRIEPTDAKIVLIEAGERLLAAFPPELSDKAKRSLEKLGVEVRLNTRVEHMDDYCVKTSEFNLPTATIVWGAGVRVDHLSQWLDVETDRSGKVAVEPDLSLPDHPEVFVIGDACKIGWKDGIDVPGIAPAAKQGGKFVARVIKDRIKGAKKQRTFKYKHYGSLATIGRNAAVIDFGWTKLTGALAWWIWGVAHVFFLIGVRQPIFVALSWFWSYLTYSKGARLITGAQKKQISSSVAATPAE